MEQVFEVNAMPDVERQLEENLAVRLELKCLSQVIIP